MQKPEVPMIVLDSLADIFEKTTADDKALYFYDQPFRVLDRADNDQHAWLRTQFIEPNQPQFGIILKDHQKDSVLKMSDLDQKGSQTLFDRGPASILDHFSSPTVLFEASPA